MSSREEILDRLRAQARPIEMPAPWASRRNYTNMVDQFAIALTAGGGEVHLAGHLEEALNQLGDVLGELGVQKATANSGPPLDQVDLIARFPGIEWATAGDSDGDFRDFAAGADVGLTGAEAALAETGTVVVSSGPGRSRLTGLLPPIHLALIPTSCLTADIFTWFAGRPDELPAALTMISGPSKTSDIEQTLITGVHGPKRFITFLYRDASPDPHSRGLDS